MGGGFLMRAQRHVAVLPPGREQGFMATLEATVALFSGDLDGALARIADGIRIGREVGDPELVALAIHTQGLAMIDAGRVAEGLALLDEAMAATVAGEVGPYFTGIIYCSLLSACLAIGDLRRAGEWSDAAAGLVRHDPPGLAVPGDVPGEPSGGRPPARRVGRGGGRGRARLRRAAPARGNHDLRGGGVPAARRDPATPRRSGRRRGGVHEGARARRGSATRSRAAAARAGQGWLPRGPRSLRRIGAAGPARPHRVRLHAANVEIALADGSIDDALASAAELGRIAEETRTPAFAAQAAQAAGSVALATGDVDGALARLREAWTGWQDLRLPYEASRARVGFARALAAAGDEEGATLELRAALAGFERLGAVRDVGEVAEPVGDARRVACRAHHAGGRGPAPARRRARRTVTSRWSS